MSKSKSATFDRLKNKIKRLLSITRKKSSKKRDGCSSRLSNVDTFIAGPEYGKVLYTRQVASVRTRADSGYETGRPSTSTSNLTTNSTSLALSNPPKIPAAYSPPPAQSYATHLGATPDGEAVFENKPVFTPPEREQTELEKHKEEQYKRLKEAEKDLFEEYQPIPKDLYTNPPSFLEYNAEPDTPIQPNAQVHLPSLNETNVRRYINMAIRNSDSERCKAFSDSEIWRIASSWKGGDGLRLSLMTPNEVRKGFGIGVLAALPLRGHGVVRAVVRAKNQTEGWERRMCALVAVYGVERLDGWQEDHMESLGRMVAYEEFSYPLLTVE